MTEHIDPIETARNNVLAAVLALQKCAQTGGTRAQIPGTNNLIMVGPADWIAANVLGVEAMVAEPGAWKPLNDVQWMNIVNHEHAYDSYSKEEAVHEAVKRTEAKLKEINGGLAATTQASTAQAEPVDAFTEWLRGRIRHEGNGKKRAAFIEALNELAATSSTDAQAAAEVRDAWISVDERLPECSKKPGSLGVEVIVYPRPEKGESTAFFGCRHADDPVFYKYGSRVEGITHWMPLPEAPSAIRSAGDTGGAS